MTIAIVILNWNGRQLLERFLPTVLTHAAAAQVYVADNASTDSSVEFLCTHYPQVSILQNPTNEGYAAGYNRALQQVQADVYCLLNSDVAVTEGWLSPVLKCFEDPQIAMVQPKILDYKRPTHFEYAGAAGGYLDKYGFPYCRGRRLQHIEEDRGQYDEPSPCPIFWASGACLFVRSTVFHALGGFDADFFAHQEEIDLCWRAHHLGHKVVCCPQSVVYHVGGATLSATNPQKTYLNFRNSLLMLLKNLPGRCLYRRLFVRMLIDGAAGAYYLFTGKPRLTWAVLRAHFYFYRHFSKFQRKRPPYTIEDYYQRKSIFF